MAKDESRLLEADSLYRQALSMRSDYTQAYINRGDVLLRLNRSREAQQQYETALTYEPDNPDIHYNLGVVHIEMQEPDRALKYATHLTASYITVTALVNAQRALSWEAGKSCGLWVGVYKDRRRIFTF